jgi:hypothetical protein
LNLKKSGKGKSPHRLVRGFLPSRLILNPTNSGVLVVMRLGVVMLFVMLARGMSGGLVAVMMMFARDGGVGRTDEGHDHCGDCEQNDFFHTYVCRRDNLKKVTAWFPFPPRACAKKLNINGSNRQLQFADRLIVIV